MSSFLILKTEGDLPCGSSLSHVSTIAVAGSQPTSLMWVSWTQLLKPSPSAFQMGISRKWELGMEPGLKGRHYNLGYRSPMQCINHSANGLPLCKLSEVPAYRKYRTSSRSSGAELPTANPRGEARPSSPYTRRTALPPGMTEEVAAEPR